MATWAQLKAWDATSDPDAEARTRPSPRLAEVLTAAGLHRVGILAIEMPAFAASHPKIRSLRIPIWSTRDRRVLVQEHVHYGVDEMELQSLLRDGTIVRTRWASRPGGIPGGWLTSDPDGPPPADTLGVRLRTSTVDPKLLAAAGHQPNAGLHTRRVDDMPAADVLQAHLDAVEAHAASAGPPEPLDVTTSGAIDRRGIEVASAVAVRDGMSRMPMMMLTMMLLSVGSMAAFLLMPELPADATLEQRLEALGAVLSPMLGTATGGAIGLLIGSTRGMGVFIALGILALPMVLSVGQLLSVGGGDLLFRPATLAWALGAFVVGLLWGRVGIPAMQRVLLRLTPRALDAVPPRPTPVVLREVYGARPYAASAPVDEVRVEVPRTEGDALLREAGWERLGARRIADREGGAPGEALWTTVSVWRSPDGAAVAEPRALRDGGVFLELRSGLEDGTVVETRTLPDPGPIERAVARTAKGAPCRTVLVTRADLARGVLWPSRAVLRVADRPLAGLRVEHVDDVDGALARHAARLDGVAATTLDSVDDAVALAQRTGTLRPEPSRTVDRLASGLGAAAAVLFFGRIFLDSGDADGGPDLNAAWLPIALGAFAGSSLLRAVPDEGEGWGTALRKATPSTFMALLALYMLARAPTIAVDHALAGLAIVGGGTYAVGRLLAERELRRTG